MPTAVHVQRGVRTANLQTDFLFRGRDVVLTMNSDKILHGVRSAITATAELLVRHARENSLLDLQIVVVVNF